MPRWQKLLRHDALIHSYKEAVRNAIAYACPRLAEVRKSIDTRGEAAPAGMEPLEPRLLLSGSISGTVFADLNNNGLHNVSSGEAWDAADTGGDFIFVDTDDDGEWDNDGSEPSTTTTGSSGSFSIGDIQALADGTYDLVIEPASGRENWVASDSYTVSYTQDATITGEDIGIRPDISISPVQLPAFAGEGMPYTINLNDPDGFVSSGWLIDWGDGSPAAPATGAAASHAYGDVDTFTLYTISATATDGLYSFDVDSFDIYLLTTASYSGVYVSSGPTPPVLEGIESIHQLTISPGHDQVTSVIAVWGDGQTDVFDANALASMWHPSDPTILLMPHTYQDYGVHNATFTVTRTGFLDVAVPYGIGVGDVVPDLQLSTAAGAVEAGEVYWLDVTADYPPGLDDTIETWQIDWGDGTTEEVSVSGTTRSFAHIYDTAGSYTIGAIALDVDGQWTANISGTGLVVGDMDGDDFVGIDDLNIVLGHWNQSVTPGNLLEGDGNGDGFVGLADLNYVLGNWNDQRASEVVSVGANTVSHTIEVTTLVDEDSTIGEISLREAIRLANAHDGADTITFADGLAGTIAMTQGEFVLSDDVTIIGPGADKLSIDAQSLSRVFKINSAIDATLQGLTITQGRSADTSEGGAGIFSEGDLVLQSSHVFGNLSGGVGIGVGGVLGGFGAGIHQSGGTVQIIDSTISGNKGAIYGGGLYAMNADLVTLINSTFSGNTSQLIGGGVAVFSDTDPTTATLTSVTIAANETGIPDFSGNPYGLGGGLAMGEGVTASVNNTLIASNINDAIPTSLDVAITATISSAKNNLIGVDPDMNNGINDGVDNNQVGGEGSADPLDPMLDILGDYGGPTLTHALLASSPAIDAGDSLSASALSHDQRGSGFSREVGTTVDIGAFEYEAYIWLEAENTTTLSSPLRVIGDLTASGNRLIMVSENGELTNTTTPTIGIASYEFDAPVDGTYRIWARTITPNSNADSFYVRMNETGPWISWDNISQDNDWQWGEIHDSGNSGTPVDFVLTAGGHTLEIAYQQDGAQLDKLLITNNMSFTPTGLGGDDPDIAGLETIDLLATVRDFHDSNWVKPGGASTNPHLDFQAFSHSIPTLNLVLPALGSDGKPILNPARPDLVSGLSSDIQFSDPSGVSTNFDMWYNDVAAYNQALDVTLRLMEDPARLGTYQFVGSTATVGATTTTAATNEFFPIDNLLFKDSTSSEYELAPSEFAHHDDADITDEIREPHNFHFTMELHAEFTYKTGQTLDILQADDDLWIYIGGALAVDLGGLHPPASSGAVALDTFDLNGSDPGGGLIDGQTYSFDLFYAERSTGASHLVFETTIDDLKPVEPKSVLVEDQSLVTTDQSVHPAGQTTTIDAPAVADLGPIRIDFSDLSFDTSSNPGDVNDAFELAILDAEGDSVVPTVGSGMGVFFNWSQGQPQLLAQGVELDHTSSNNFGGVIVDLSNIYTDNPELSVGDPLTLVARLVNNDAAGDDATTVSIDFNVVARAPQPATLSTSSPVLLETPDRTLNSSASFNTLSDVTHSFDIDYKYTSYLPNTDSTSGGTLFTSLDLTKTNLVQVRGDLILAVRGLYQQDGAHIGSQSDAQLYGFDGFLPVAVDGVPAGTPYLNLTHLLPSGSGGFYEVNQTIQDLLLSFKHPGNDRFDFNMVLLGQTNKAPSITSDPYAGNQGLAYPVTLPATQGTVLEISDGNTLRYALTTTDPNDDPVTVSIVSGPSSMALIDTNGDGIDDALEWTPQATDVATHEVKLRATDIHGLYDPAYDQTFRVKVVTGLANRPPRFDTDPVLEVEIGTPYNYPSHATDLDGDTLAYEGAIGAQPKRYEISVGHLAGDVMSYLTLFNETAGDESAAFSNIRLFESNWAGEPQVIRFSDHRFQEYGTGGSSDATLNVGGDGALVRISGDKKWAYQLDTPYTITANTVLAFTYISNDEGLEHGLGLVTDLSGTPTAAEWFQVHGTQTSSDTYGNTSFNDYDPAWSTTPDFQVDINTGVVTWTNPPADLIGEWVHVDLTARDQQAPELSDTQSYDIQIKADPINHDPSIISDPGRNHVLPNLPAASADPVTPTSIAITLDEGQPIDLPVSINLPAGANSADIVFVLDHTTSMSVETDWIADTVDDVDQALIASGITNNQYGLVGYESSAFEISVGGSLFGTAAELQAAADGVSLFGATENGYAGLLFALNDGKLSSDPDYYHYRPEAVTVIVLVTDDDADDYTSTKAQQINNLIERNPNIDSDDVILNVVTLVNVDEGSTPILGEDADLDLGYKADGSGGVIEVVNPSVTGFAGGPFDDYYNELVVPNGGLIWDIDLIQTAQSDPDLASSIAIAFTESIADRISDQLTLRVESDTTDLQFSVAPDPAGDEDDFIVSLVGDGRAHSFNLNFIQGDSTIRGTIPVAVHAAYTYDLVATDPDDDMPLTFELVSAPTGATLDVDRITWDVPDSAGGTTAFFKVHVSDGRGGIGVQTWTVDVLAPAANAAPNIDTVQADIPDLTEQRPFEFPILASDTDPDDVLRYYLIDDPNLQTPPPAWLNIDRNTGIVSGTPLAGQTGTFDFTVLVSDGRLDSVTHAKGEAHKTFTITVDPAPAVPINSAPVITPGAETLVVAGDKYYYDAFATDDDEDPLTWSLVNAPDWLGIDEKTGIISGNPQEADVGVFYIVLRVSDGDLHDYEEFWLDVVSSNLDPVLQPADLPRARVGVDQDLSTPEADPYTYTLDVTDPNGDDLYFVVDPVSEGLGISVVDGVLSWDDPETEPGIITTYPITVGVFDGRGGFDQETYYLEVGPDADPRLIFDPADAIYLEESWTYTVKAEDAEDGLSGIGSGLTFSIDSVSLSRQLTIGAETGVMQWTPDSLITQPVIVTVTDSFGNSSSATLTLPVNERPSTNVPPTVIEELTGPASEGLRWTYTLKTADEDDDTVTITLTSWPSWFNVTDPGNSTVSSGSMMLTGIPTGVAEGGQIDEFTFTINDGQGHGDIPVTLRLAVQDNAPPVFVSAVSSANAALGGAIDLGFELVDYNGDDLLIELVSPAPGTGVIQLDGSGTAVSLLTGVSTDLNAPTVMNLSFTPDVVGLNHVTLRATDTYGNVTEHTIKLDVYDPTVTIGASLSSRNKLQADEPYVAQVELDDPSQQPLIQVYALLDGGGNRVTTLTTATGTSGGGLVPDGLSIDSAGRITWTPGQADINDSAYTFVVVVDTDSDPESQILLGPADLTVVSRLVNSDPVIDPIEASRASGGDPLSFTATATDADNDPLTWSLVEGPSTASIEPDGRFLWTPSEDEYGLEQEVRIRVEDDYGGSDEVTLTLNANSTLIPGNSSPRITSEPQPSTSAGNGYTYVYDITAVDDEGDPIAFRLEGTTAHLSGLIITDHGDGTATLEWADPTAEAFKSFTIVAEDNRGLAGRQTIEMTIGSAPSQPGVVDTPPEFLNDPTFSVVAGNTYTYDTEVSDPDGTPVVTVSAIREGDELVIPGSDLSITNGDTVTWNTSLAQVGTYLVTVTATQAGATLERTYRMRVIDPAEGVSGPTIQGESLQASPGQSFTYDVIAVDDQTAPLTYYLVDDGGKRVSEIDGLSIGGTGRVSWDIPEDYALSERSFTVLVEDADGLTDQLLFEIDLVSDALPTVTLWAQTTAPEVGDSVTFVVSAGDDVGLQDVQLVITPPQSSEMSPVTLPVPSNGQVTYNFTGAADGDVYQVQAFATDTANQVSTSAIFDIEFRAPDQNAPSVNIATPLPGPTVTETVDLLGWIEDLDGNLVRYIITATPLSGGQAVTLKEWTKDSDGAILNTNNFLEDIGSQSSHAVLATINPSILDNGTYRIDVLAEDDSNRGLVGRTFELIIDSPAVGKLGNITLSETDLTTLVGGIPISVLRSYDSYTTDQAGDFGFGWSFELLEGRIDIADLVENEFTRDGFFSPGLRYGSRISVTLPGGDALGFTAIPNAFTDGSGLTGAVTIAFQPDDDARGYLLEFSSGKEYLLQDQYYFSFGYDGYHDRYINSVPIFMNDNGQFIQSTIGSGGLDDFAIPYNPADDNKGYRLTAPDGTVYDFDAHTGKVLSATDPFKNKISYDQGDIVATQHGNETGRLQVTRVNGRITQVKTPDGDAVQYYYDNDGNLAAFRDRSGRWTTYRYDENLPADFDGEHILTSITKYPDPTTIGADYVTIQGVTGIDTVIFSFDADGKLSKIEDASAASVDVSYVLDGPSVGLPSGYSIETVDNGESTTETIRDHLGRAVRRIQWVSEDAGDATYLISVFEFDDLDNLIVEWSPFEFVESGANNLRYTVLPENSGSIKLVDSTFDEFGRTLNETDALGNITKYLDYDSAGNPGSIVDPLNNVTKLRYIDGNLDYSINVNPDGPDQQLRFDYDTLGNPEELGTVKKDGSVVVTTRYKFDDKSRLIESVQTDPDGPEGSQVAQTRYYRYDALDNLILTFTHETDPTAGDQTLVTHTLYDAEGRVTGINRYTLTGKIYLSDTTPLTGETPDSSSAIEYDGMGRAYKSTDSFGTISYTFFDRRGQVTETAQQALEWNGSAYQAAWLVNRTVYDNLGRAKYTLDAQIVLDSDADESTYDRPADLTGYGTISEYDALGRVIEVKRVNNLTVSADDSTYGGYLVETSTTASGLDTVSLSETGYDGQGRVEYTVEHNDPDNLTDNIRMDYYYDANGTLIGTLGPITRINGTTVDVRVLSVTGYDAGGRQEYTTTGLAILTSVSGFAEHPELSEFFDVNDKYALKAGVGDNAYSMPNTIQFGYDAFGQVTQTTYVGDPTDTADDIVTETIYDLMGRQIADIDPLNRQTDYEYDDAGRLTAVNLPAITIDDPENPGNDLLVQPRYEYRYDQDGNQIAITDNAYRIVSSGIVKYLKKDAVSHDDVIYSVTEGTIPDRSTEFEYDYLGRQISRTLADNQVEKFKYNDDAIGTITPADRHSSVGFGQLEYHESFEGKATTYRYDNRAAAGGRLVAKYYYNDLASYTSDNDGTLDNYDEAVFYTYDAFGRQVKVFFDRNGDGVEDAADEVTTYDYDELGRLIRTVSPEGAVNHAYNDRGQLTRTYTGDQIADLDNYTPAASDGIAITDTEYQYDDFGRLSAVITHERFDTPISGVGEVNTYHYDLIGNLDYTVLDNGVISDYVYDAHNRLDILQHFTDHDVNGTAFVYDDGIDTLLSKYDYERDLAGNRVSAVETDDQNNVTNLTWIYDDLNRLVKEVRDTNAAGQTDHTDIFTFDLVGNRLTKTHFSNVTETGSPDVTTYQYDNSDRLLNESFDQGDDTVVDKTTVYTYDQTQQDSKKVYAGVEDPGNLTSTTTFTYNLQGRLYTQTHTEGAATTTTTYTYNDQGIRVSQRVDDGIDDTITYYVIDTNNHTGYAQVLEEHVDDDGPDAPNTPQLQRAFTIGHDVIVQADITLGSGVPLYLLADGHGSTRQLSVPVTGAVLERYAYDAYGNTLDGGNLKTASDALTRILYSGEWTHNDGTQYLRARYYDPAAGRFNRLDPFAGNQHDPQSLHKYLYTHANPIMGTDPSGLFTMIEILGVGNGFQSFEKLHSANKKVSTTAKTAKVLVNIAMLQMGAISQTMRWLDSARPLMIGYYGFLWANFVKNYKGAVKSKALVSKVDDISGYLAALPKGAERIRTLGYGGIPQKRTNFLPAGQDKPFMRAWIPYTGSRSRDGTLAYASAIGFQISSIMDSVQSGGSWVRSIMKQARETISKSEQSDVEFFTKAKVWHHNEILGAMELLDKTYHTSIGHTGGVKFYQILMKKKRYR